MLIVAAAAALACPQRARSKSPREYWTVAGGVRYHASSSIDPGNGDCRTTFAGRVWRMRYSAYTGTRCRGGYGHPRSGRSQPSGSVLPSAGWADAQRCRAGDDRRDVAPGGHAARRRVIIASHDPRVRHHARHVITLRDGTVITRGSATTLPASRHDDEPSGNNFDRKHPSPGT